MGSSDTLVGDYIAGHILPGVAENYFAPWSLEKEYQNAKKFLNPRLSEKEKYAQVGDRLDKQGETIETLRAENRALREQAERQALEIQEVRALLSQLIAQAGKPRADQLVEAIETETNGT